MLGFNLGTVKSKKKEKEYHYIDIFFTEKWYKRVWLTKKQFEIVSSWTISVIDN